MYDFLVVGAGFSGCVIAERIATQLGRSVLVVEERNHIGGAAHDNLDDRGVLIHKYGPHIFHTNKARVIRYLSRFTRWRPYNHKVLTKVNGKAVPLPINMNTINRIYGFRFRSPRQVREYLSSVRVPIREPSNAEEAMIARIGWDLYDKIIHGYTRKQWGIDPRELAPSLTERIEVRTNGDDRYFTDLFQMIPADGYTAMMRRMLNRRGIRTLLGVDFHEIESAVRFRHLVYTGPIDRYFGYAHGRLSYRSLRFKHEHDPTRSLVNRVGQINYPNHHRYTRITESKHITGQSCRGTTLTYEFPIWPENGSRDLYYPVPTCENARIFERYACERNRLKAATFCGRLADYKYYNMDQVVERALDVFERRLVPLCRPPVIKHEAAANRQMVGGRYS